MNITRVEMCESLMEKMAVEEQEAIEECKDGGEAKSSFDRHGGRSEREERGRIVKLE